MYLIQLGDVIGGIGPVGNHQLRLPFPIHHYPDGRNYGQSDCKLSLSRSPQIRQIRSREISCLRSCHCRACNSCNQCDHDLEAQFHHGVNSLIGSLVALFCSSMNAAYYFGEEAAQDDAPNHQLRSKKVLGTAATPDDICTFPSGRLLIANCRPII